MKPLTQTLQVLSRQEMDQIHQAAVRILERTGMRIDHGGALDYLEAAGCLIDRNTLRCRFPRRVVEQAVERMRAAYGARQHLPESMAVRYSRIKFHSEPLQVHPNFTVSMGGFCSFIFDLDGRRRTAELEDVRASLRLAQHLEHVDYTGLPVADQTIPAHQRPIRMAAELVKHTGKLGGVEAFCLHDVEYITRIAEVVAGGAEELRRNPILVGYGEVRSPLCLDHNMADIFIAYLKRGLPQTLETMPNAGATAPMSAAGTLALGTAETLGGLVLAYSVDPDAIVGVDFNPSYCDMSSGLFQYSGGARWPLIAARVQMISGYYGCPSGVHGGKTDACRPGAQVGAEKMASMLFPVLAGAIGIGTLGHLENAVTYSPMQAVIDNEIAGCVKRTISGITVDDEALALDLIDSVGPGGNFLQEEHTLANFREELFLPDLFRCQPWESDWAADAKSVEERATETARELMARPVECPLSVDQCGQIDAIVQEGAAKSAAG
jgi:trimethylamine---corrinoid protein Co-methyltransferase